LGDKLGYLAFYQPITGEAIIRDDLPQLLKPFTLEHEKAHQKGYASETEANFIAFMTAQETKDPLLKYSTQIQLFTYAQNATLWLVAKKGDFDLWKKIVERNKKLITPKVLADRQKIKSFLLQGRMTEFQDPIKFMINSYNGIIKPKVWKVMTM